LFAQLKKPPYTNLHLQKKVLGYLKHTDFARFNLVQVYAMSSLTEMHYPTGASGASCSPDSTPSPSTSSATAHSSARRPPRKSTLTQQQKNNKRQRATQDQLVLLEIEFNKNPTPTAATRERIASDINMTERSVQIWFQNR
jgi:hypothetical protein